MWRDQAWRCAAVKMAQVQPEDVVLDVACGTGDLSEAFHAAHPRQVIGSDFTVPMLQIAQHKAGRLHTSGTSPAYHAAERACACPSRIRVWMW